MSDYQNGTSVSNDAQALKAWHQQQAAQGSGQGSSGLAGMLQKAPSTITLAELVDVQRRLLSLLGTVNDLMQRLGSR